MSVTRGGRPHGGASARAFGRRDVVSYAAGDAANDLTFVVVTTFFMLYATNVMGIAAGHVGTLFLVVRLVDAFFDLWWGRFIDSRTVTCEGRFRPWLRRMAPLSLVFVVVCFQPWTPDWSYAVRLAFVAAAYLCYGIAYSGVNIPYGSMATAITDDPRHRSRLSVGRSVGAIVASAVPMVVLPVLVYRRDAAGSEVIDPYRMFLAVVWCALVSGVLYGVCYRGSIERVTSVEPGCRLTVRQLVTSMVANRALTALIVASVLLLFITGILQAMAPYLWLDYFHDGSLQSLSGIALMGPSIIIAIFATRLAHRFGKKELIAAGLCLSALASLVLFATQTTSPVLLLALIAVAGVGAGLQTVLAWALIGDAIDLHEVTTGQRDDATVYAAYIWARKVGQAVASGMGGWLLARVGYVSSSGTHVQQSASTLRGIYAISTLLPGVLFVALVIVMIWWYPLRRSDVERNASTLRARRSAEAITPVLRR